MFHWLRDGTRPSSALQAPMQQSLPQLWFNTTVFVVTHPCLWQGDFASGIDPEGQKKCCAVHRAHCQCDMPCCALLCYASDSGTWLCSRLVV